MTVGDWRPEAWHRDPVADAFGSEERIQGTLASPYMLTGRRRAGLSEAQAAQWIGMLAWCGRIGQGEVEQGFADSRATWTINAALADESAYTHKLSR